MRILHIISGLDPRAGGTVSALEGLARALVANGVDVEIVAPWIGGFDPSVAKRLRAAGVTITQVGPTKTKLGWHPKLSPTVREAVQRADVVHLHGLWEEIQHRAAVHSRNQQKPYVVSPHGMLDPWSLAQSKARKQLYLAWRLRRTLNRADALHFTAEIERELTEPLQLHAPSIIEPNGLDLDQFGALPDPSQFRQAWPELGPRPYVLFLSRVHPKKGLELLIPAFAQAAPEAYALVIAGPGEPGYVDRIRGLAEEHGLSDRLVMPGMIEGQVKLAAYAGADLFVLPSHQENFGIVIIEALACGTPVVISDQVNIHREIERAGVGAVVSTAIDPLAQTLKQWLNTPNLRTKAAEKASAFVHERYGWNPIAQRWKGHYERLAPSQAR